MACVLCQMPKSMFNSVSKLQVDDLLFILPQFLNPEYVTIFSLFTRRGDMRWHFHRTPIRVLPLILWGQVHSITYEDKHKYHFKYPKYTHFPLNLSHFKNNLDVPTHLYMHASISIASFYSSTYFSAHWEHGACFNFANSKIHQGITSILEVGYSLRSLIWFLVHYKR